MQTNAKVLIEEAEKCSVGLFDQLRGSILAQLAIAEAMLEVAEALRDLKPKYFNTGPR